MKLQDIVFLFVFLFLLWKRHVRLLAIVGMVCVVVAIPLFAKWVFFTAERLTWYAALFFLAALILFYFQRSKR